MTGRDRCPPEGSPGPAVAYRSRHPSVTRSFPQIRSAFRGPLISPGAPAIAGAPGFSISLHGTVAGTVYNRYRGANARAGATPSVSTPERPTSPPAGNSQGREAVKEQALYCTLDGLVRYNVITASVEVSVPSCHFCSLGPQRSCQRCGPFRLQPLCLTLAGPPAEGRQGQTPRGAVCFPIAGEGLIRSPLRLLLPPFCGFLRILATRSWLTWRIARRCGGAARVSALARQA